MRPALCSFVLFSFASFASFPPSRHMAITFDDLPKVQYYTDASGSRRTTEAILAGLKKHHAPAVAFVNEEKLYDGERLVPERAALLKLWLDAGVPLGNHTFSHRDINRRPLEVYERDVRRGESVWLPLMAQRGWTQKWFRHPFTHTGDTPAKKAGLERYLKTHGYRVAPFTIENSDFLFAKVYALAKHAGDRDKAERARADYLAYTGKMIDWFETLAREDFGRDIPQILLIHANDLHEDALDTLLTNIEQRGYTFVTLDEAMKDPAYATRDDYVGPVGPSWLHRWRIAKQLPWRLKDEPDPPGWIVGAAR